MRTIEHSSLPSQSAKTTIDYEGTITDTVGTEYHNSQLANTQENIGWTLSSAVGEPMKNTS